MAINWSEPGLPVSGAIHVLCIVATLVAFSTPPKFEEMSESVPVEIVNADEPNQIAKGEKSAKEAKPDPKPRADKVAAVTETKLHRLWPTPKATSPKSSTKAIRPSSA